MLIPMLKRFESKYSQTTDSYVHEFDKAFHNLRLMFEGMHDTSRMIATNFVNDVDSSHRRKFSSIMRDAMGIDINQLLSDDNVRDVLLASNRENVALIKSIPAEYFKKIEHIIFTETVRKKTAKSLIEQIVAIGHSTVTRARLIARDQTSKLNSHLNQHRQQGLGISEFVWLTADDARVRQSHKKNNGKVFRWDTPPEATGHPGHNVQCRCVAQAIINV